MNALIPSTFFLSQNYPDPFSEDTKIKYCLPIRTKVNLSIFSADGEKVTELINKTQDAGVYELDFKRGLLAEGTYYYTIKADNPYSKPEDEFIETKKMILLK
jgi:hypothetical protein